MIHLAYPLVYVDTNDFEGYATKELYNEMRLQMSTGDFHTHTAYEVIAVDDMEADSEFFELVSPEARETDGLVYVSGTLSDIAK